MKNLFFLWMTCTVLCSAQITVPEGTKVRLRLEQTVSSATAETGETLEFVVTQGVEIGGTVVIADGARATGTINKALERRTFGRSGRFDFSIDRVMAIDRKWIPLRYTLTKEKGVGRAITTTIVTATTGPFGLLLKGKDISVLKGTTFEAFADENTTISGIAPGAAKASARGMYATYQIQPAGQMQAAGSPPAVFAPQPGPAMTPVSTLPEPGAMPVIADGFATISIDSPRPGSEIVLDGMFVGNTPSTIKLAAGPHEITVSKGALIWHRTVSVTAGSSITLIAAPNAAASIASQRSPAYAGQ